jgi:hypothetical protein
MLIELLGIAKILLLVQAPQSSVAGTIRDSDSGQPLPDAVVVLTDIDRSVVSDSSGRYSFADVPPGPQHLTTKCIGYAPRTLHALVPGEGRLQINIALQPVPMQLATIVVRSTVAVRGLENADSTPFPERGISMAAVRNDPLLAEPDGLLGLGGGEIGASPEAPSGLHLRGGASDQTGYLLDGIPVFSPYHAAGTFSAWNPDALERLQASSAAPSLAFPDALSGTVSAVTRAPGSAVRMQGGMSTSQARVAVDGPLGRRGAGYLVSFRTGFPALIAPRHEASYLKGAMLDLIAKVEAAALGGSLRFLLYEAASSIGSIAAISATDGAPLRNAFEWDSRSLGAQWARRTGSSVVRLQTWTASSDAEAAWIAGAPIEMTAERRDDGLLAMVEHSRSGSSTNAGLRIERSRTGYRVASGDSAGSNLELRATTPVATMFLQHQRPLGGRVGVNAALSAASASGPIHLNLQTQVRWQLSDPLALSASYARSRQFAQSLRNSESVVGNVFPADLYIGAGAPGVPVARNDRAVLAADYRPVSGVRLGAQAYLSNYAGLLLVAPETGQPFATDRFTTGRGTVPGFSLDAALSGARYGLVARYGWQRVRLKHADSSYTPIYGTSHLFELGGIVFPSATSSVRLGLTGGLGRRATGITGSFEWEACNLLDRGCEFSGDPQATGALGALRLPAYLRLDLSARKHWHLNVGGKDVTLALFGTMTNLLGRTNLLTVATDPVSGDRTVVEMRPRAPLVIGLDWRF